MCQRESAPCNVRRRPRFAISTPGQRLLGHRFLGSAGEERIQTDNSEAEGHVRLDESVEDQALSDQPGHLRQDAAQSELRAARSAAQLCWEALDSERKAEIAAVYEEGGRAASCSRSARAVGLDGGLSHFASKSV